MRHAVLMSLLTGFVLTGCSLFAKEPLHPRPMCPPLVEWNAEDTDELARQVIAFQYEAPMLVRATSELYTLRRQCKRVQQADKR